jgi:tRNA pseudouridine32 synthase / 23S rRNA pseudouridine746 synthase
MGISPYPSTVTMPEASQPYPSILEFLTVRFPSVSRKMWEERFARGKLLDGSGHPLTADAAYAPGRQIRYFREVSDEPTLPSTETILFQDDELLVACKPHFLPVTPGGRYVNECLLNQLRLKSGNDDLAPLHRIDRETAGIVLFSVNRENRNRYAELFRRGAVEKSYLALSRFVPPQGKTWWEVADRIVQGEPWFRMKTATGTVNARSLITLMEVQGGMARFQLQPQTGKTHQLRLHMSGLGFGIANDRLYPHLQPESPDDFRHPLQLLAKSIRFVDPVTGARREFVSPRELSW